MSARTETEVIIGGQVLTLSGNESEEYLQKVASYINNKILYEKRWVCKQKSTRRKNHENKHFVDKYTKEKRKL